MVTTCPRGLKFGAFSVALGMVTTAVLTLIPAAVDSAFSDEASVNTTVGTSETVALGRPNCNDPKNRHLKVCRLYLQSKERGYGQWFDSGLR